MNIKSIALGGLAVLALLCMYLLVTRSSVFGATPTGQSHYQLETFIQGLQIGQRGTAISASYQGTCNLSQSSAGSHAATTSKEYFCAVTGVAAGDRVDVILPAGAGAYTSGASSPLGGFVVGSAYATTSNVIAVTITNLTGAATSSFAQATTSAVYKVSR